MLRISATMILLAGVFSVRDAPLAAEPFKRLRGPDIERLFTGQELTDQVHWAMVFEKRGRFSTFENENSAHGTWRVENDKLCMQAWQGEPRCDEVWASGVVVQLRFGNEPATEGTLEPARDRGHKDLRAASRSGTNTHHPR